MEVLPIGSITIFTNVSDRQRYLFDSDLDRKVSEVLADWFQDELRKKFPDLSVVVIEYDTKIGCIITPVLIGIAVAKTVGATTAVAVAGTGVTLGAVYKFVTDYDKIKKNIKEIGKDINNLWLKIIHRKNSKVEEKNQFAKDETEKEIKIYQEIPDELKKYYTADKDTVVISEKETITYHKICIMREDIKEDIQKEITEKEIRTIKLKSA